MCEKGKVAPSHWRLQPNRAEFGGVVRGRNLGDGAFHDLPVGRFACSVQNGAAYLEDLTRYHGSAGTLASASQPDLTSILRDSRIDWVALEKARKTGDGYFHDAGCS